jgi:hypothetical protein
MIIDSIENIEYYKFFYSTVTAGICCGLGHPIEWIINIHRTPGGTLGDNYYKTVETHVPRFLYELFQNLYLEDPEDADDIIKMCNSHYKNSPNQFCNYYFAFLIPQIQKYIESKNNKFYNDNNIDSE